MKLPGLVKFTKFEGTKANDVTGVIPPGPTVVSLRRGRLKTRTAVPAFQVLDCRIVGSDPDDIRTRPDILT